MMMSAISSLVRRVMTRWLEFDDFHSFVAQVIYNFDGNAARCWLGEWPGYVAVQARPGIFVDFRLECGLEGFVWVIGAQKVGLAHEETLFVVVGVDEPAGYSFRVVASDLPRGGVVDVNSVDSYLEFLVP